MDDKSTARKSRSKLKSRKKSRHFSSSTSSSSSSESDQTDDNRNGSKKKRMSSSSSTSSSSSSRSRSSSKRGKKRRKSSSKKDSYKKKKSKTPKKKKKRSRSSSASSSSSSPERKKKRKKKKKKKKKKEKCKRETKVIAVELQLPVKEKNSPDAQHEDVPTGRRSGPKPRVIKPMTREEWEKQQSIIRRVYDEETGRERLIKGDGEVLEEIVTKNRHLEINKTATRGDGQHYAKQLGML
ncbi:unnamed protein product [Lymnaea stagnalis]|uniref:ADP-ribosylation factor-like protein 6-interacting protein 4 n=1 Tax=Lymnaea stagnalis TaxID=6523 RepID=A0AAV2HLE4_LYMST